MDEFQLIDLIVKTLGPAAQAPWVRVGPGDDCTVTDLPAGRQLVSSIDTLLADVHFPAGAQPQLIGYRAMMVSLSDVVAMGANPAFVMLALTLPDADEPWVRGLADGIGRAASVSGAAVAGGNLTRGPVCLTISVHGSLPAGTALLRSGAQPGDGIYLSGEIGGAAAALQTGKLEDYLGLDDLDAAGRAYFAPAPPFHLADAIRAIASAAIDVSDGLLQDLGHLCKASDVGMDLIGNQIPVFAGMSIAQAVNGSDDYVLCFTSSHTVDLPGTTRIGSVVAQPGIRIDGVAQTIQGYQHFRS